MKYRISDMSEMPMFVEFVCNKKNGLKEYIDVT
jgi:hypothetical protein